MEARPDETVVRRRFRVSGRVQGVGFRAWTLRRARELGLRGTVSNRADGSVEVEAGGPADAIDRLRQLVSKGPPLAVVKVVQELEPGNTPLPEGFEVGGY
jgi:acylphosphatase